MIRQLFTIASALSLLLCVVFAALWAVSYRMGASLTWENRNLARSICISSAAGHLSVERWWGLDYVIERDGFRGSTFAPDDVVIPYAVISYEEDQEQYHEIDRTRMGLHQTYFGTSHHGYDATTLPWGGLDISLLIMPTLYLCRWYARRSRRALRGSLCPICGYDLRATPDRCPECGTAFGSKLRSNLAL